MKSGYTHISMLLDRSGSMDSIKSFIIEGFNNFIKDQKKEAGELSVTLVQFDTDYEVLFDFKGINDIPLLTDKIYIPRGMTALNDSWVKLIEETGAKLASYKEEDRPEKVLLISLSDGLENASKKYAPPEGDKFIKDLVERQEKDYNWKFLYIGANQDSKKEGALRGVNNFMNFAGNEKSIRTMSASLSAETSNYRSRKDNSFNVKVDEN